MTHFHIRATAQLEAQPQSMPTDVPHEHSSPWIDGAHDHKVAGARVGVGVNLHGASCRPEATAGIPVGYTRRRQA